MMDYEKLLSRTAQEIEPSGIRRFFDLLGDRKDIVALTVGQPDFVTPWHIRVAAVESLEQGRTYYTSNSGTAELWVLTALALKSAVVMPSTLRELCSFTEMGMVALIAFSMTCGSMFSPR